MSMKKIAIIVIAILIFIEIANAFPMDNHQRGKTNILKNIRIRAISTWLLARKVLVSRSRNHEFGQYIVFQVVSNP